MDERRAGASWRKAGQSWALCGAVLLSCWVPSAEVRAQEGASAQVAITPSFPRCELDKKAKKRFLETHARGLLAIADARFEEAVPHFEEALELCPDDEVLWYLARLYERLGEEDKQRRFDEMWRAQRELQGLSKTLPEAPSWVKEARVASAVQMASLELDETQKANTGTYPIPLPQFYRGFDGIEQIRKGAAYRFADELARMSVETMPARAGVTLWLADGTYLGEAPLKELFIPAGVELVIVVKLDGEQVLVRHVDPTKARAHQKLFIELP